MKSEPATAIRPNVTCTVTVSSGANNVEATFLPPILGNEDCCGLDPQDRSAGIITPRHNNLPGKRQGYRVWFMRRGQRGSLDLSLSDDYAIAAAAE
jgi:hypothetical protein